jgi:hypothetical protein
LYNVVQRDQNCGNYLAILGQIGIHLAEITNFSPPVTVATILL